MTKYLIALLLCVANVATAQVTFTHELSWAQIQAKARQEHKYIFVDVYTTWCQPCKMLDKEIFTQPEVGAFMNAHFLNVHVQFDSTAHDNAEVKAFYPDVQAINKIKNSQFFPTLLFFNPEGELIHYSVGAPVMAAGFLDRARAALDPQQQYVTLQKRYTGGERTPAFLKQLYEAAQLAQDMDLYHEVANDYLRQQPDLLQPDLVSVILTATRQVNDPGFAVLQQHGAYIDSLSKKPVTNEHLNSILFDEVLLPMLRKDGKKEMFNSMMYAYKGDVIRPIDWAQVKTSLDKRFPAQSDSLIVYAKPIYDQWVTEADNAKAK